MSKRGDREFLYDIAEACRRIEKYVKGLRYEDFIDNNEKQDAVIRNLEIIGEAVKRLSQKLKEKYKTIKWKRIAGMRDRLIHDYFGIDINVVWLTVTKEVPMLKQKIEEILKNLDKL